MLEYCGYLFCECQDNYNHFLRRSDHLPKHDIKKLGRNSKIHP